MVLSSFYCARSLTFERPQIDLLCGAEGGSFEMIDDPEIRQSCEMRSASAKDDFTCSPSRPFVIMRLFWGEQAGYSNFVGVPG